VALAYRYVAFTPSGEQAKGLIDAGSEGAAEQVLWERGYRIVTLRATRSLPRLDEIFPTLFSVKTREIITLSRQMATLIESGIAVMPALELLRRQAGRSLSRVLGDVIDAVKQGAALSDALRKHSQVFPPIYGRMIAVGERTGSLDVVLRQLATHLEKEQAIIKRVRGALAYPAFVILLAIGVVAIVVTTALPPLMNLFEEFDAELPLPTKILLAVSHYANAYWLHASVVLVVVAIIGGVYVRQPKGRRQLDYALLRMPLLGSIVVLSNAARFSGTTAILLRAGIPVSEVVNLAIDTTGNRIVRERLREVEEQLLRGEGLSKPLADSKIFPPMLVQMVEVGEETGTLDGNLETMAEFYASQVDERISAVTGMITPALTLIVGAMVALIALSIIMPMYEIMGSIQAEGPR
jgi:type IV pilus assembly protein PilC